MVDLRMPGEEPGTLLGIAILDAERRLRYRQVWLTCDMHFTVGKHQILF